MVFPPDLSLQRATLLGVPYADFRYLQFNCTPGSSLRTKQQDTALELTKPPLIYYLNLQLHVPASCANLVPILGRRLEHNSRGLRTSVTTIGLHPAKLKAHKFNMSILEYTTETTKSGPRTKQSACSSHDIEELAKLDSIYERIRKCVPITPYILTVPTDHPYRHWSQQESQGWMLGNLFDSDEEHLQYRTFKFRESLKSCFVTRTEEDEEKEKNEKLMKSRGRNTPVQGPKKKISLSAYKANKANGLSGTPTSKKPSPDLGPVKRDPIHVNGVKDEPKTSPAPKPGSQQGHKR